MSETPPNAELLGALGRMVRGLSILFWFLPLALVVCTMTALGEWFRQFGVVPALIVTAALCYGLSLLCHFQKQERPWIAALDRARFLALVNFGLSPFLYWWSRVPSHHFLTAVVQTLIFTGLLFLICLNPVLARLAAMLPDETLRHETRLFTSLNRTWLVIILTALSAYALMLRLDPGMPDRFIGWILRVTPLPQQAVPLIALLERGRVQIFILLALFPVAMTMALIWKIKELILASVFGPEH
jgi:hypothetical protein